MFSLVKSPLFMDQSQVFLANLHIWMLKSPLFCSLIPFFCGFFGGEVPGFLPGAAFYWRMSSAWMVLLVEPLHGVTFALAWTAAIDFVKKPQVSGGAAAMAAVDGP